MRTNKKGFFILSIFLIGNLFFLLPSYQTFLYMNRNNSKIQLKSSADPSISILGNSQLASEADSGSGTAIDPYIIENRTIDGDIHIQDTTAFFIVKNCTVYGGSNGIDLFRVINSELNNNTIYNQERGIKVDNSNHTKIRNNIIFNTNRYGIYVSGNTRNISIYNNNIYDNDGDGIQISALNITSYKNHIYNNSGNGMDVIWSENIVVYENHIYNNFDNGIRISNSNHTMIKNNNIYNNSESGIFLTWNQENITVVENMIYDNLGGIYLYESNNTIISYNDLYTNDWVGIHVFNSWYNILFNNIIVFHEYGIRIGIVYYSNITENFIRCSLEGISYYWISIPYNWTNIVENNDIKVLEPEEPPRFLQINIYSEIITRDYINLTYIITNNTGFDVEVDIFTFYANNSDCTSNVEHLNNGLYFISLINSTFSDEDTIVPISILISKTGYINASLSYTLTFNFNDSDDSDDPTNGNTISFGYFFILFIILGVVSLLFLSRQYKSK